MQRRRCPAAKQSANDCPSSGRSGRELHTTDPQRPAKKSKVDGTAIQIVTISSEITEAAMMVPVRAIGSLNHSAEDREINRRDQP